MRDYPYWPGGPRPPRTGRIYDRSRHDGPEVTNHSLANREESIYGLLGLTTPVLPQDLTVIIPELRRGVLGLPFEVFSHQNPNVAEGV